MADYTGFKRAQLSLEYLHTNSTTHDFLFGAVAEMVDNARDAQANELDIYPLHMSSLRGGYALCFLDDGEGMSPEEAARIVTFGYSEKRAKSDNLIGMYGNGLKSGSMRIGNDLMVFTKRGKFLTILFLSRTFHDTECLQEVIVPVPSFDSLTRQPIDECDRELHAKEVALILKYSPFKSLSELMSQFDRISGDSGTLVMVYNLKLLDTGDPELSFTSNDLILPNASENEFGPDVTLHEEQKSFGAYCSILYIDPRMKICIKGVKVRTRKVLSDLYKPKMYKYSSSRFKTRSETEVKKTEADAAKFEHLARESESNMRELQKRCAAQLTNQKLRQECRRAEEDATRLRQQAQLYKQLAEKKKRDLKNPKTLTMYFGVHVNDRKNDGIFVYNCSRLISMYHTFQEGVPRGIVGVVNVPYLVLEPTQNKQSFADAKEFRHLIRVMTEHAMSYWRDLGLNSADKVTTFWSDFGYLKADWSSLPSEEPKYLRKRRCEVPVVIQCDSCLKWRVLPFSINPPTSYPADWHCAKNTDPSCNRCGAPEKSQPIPEATYQRPAVDTHDAAEKLEEDIRRKQAQLAKMQPVQETRAKDTSHTRTDNGETPSAEVKSPDVESSSRHLRARRSATNLADVVKRENGYSEAVRDEEKEEEIAETKKRKVQVSPKGRGAVQRESNRISARRATKAESSEEEEEEEESSDDEVVINRKREVRKPHKATKPSPARKRPTQRKKPVEVEVNEEDDEDEEEESEEEEEQTSRSKRSRAKPSTVNLSTGDVGSLVENYRACLKYFLPPSWKKYNKDSISAITASKLVKFPQNEFFEEYERGLKNLVGKLRDDSNASKKQLENVRRMVATLLERLMDKPSGTLMSCVSDNPNHREIDDLLKTCVEKTCDKKSVGESSSSTSLKSQGKSKVSSSR